MPNLSDPPKAALLTLNQALRYMAEEYILDESADPRFEPVLAPHNGQRQQEWAALLNALQLGDLPIYGRPGVGDIVNHGGHNTRLQGWGFSQHGDFVQIPVSRLKECGKHGLEYIEGFALFNNAVRHVIKGDVHLEGIQLLGSVEAGWEYVGIAIASEDLLTIFPPNDGREIAVPRVTDRPSEHATAIQPQVCGGQLFREKLKAWLEGEANAEIDTVPTMKKADFLAKARARFKDGQTLVTDNIFDEVWRSANIPDKFKSRGRRPR